MSPQQTNNYDTFLLAVNNGVGSTADFWFSPPTLNTLIDLRKDTALWAIVRASAAKVRINLYDLDKAIDTAEAERWFQRQVTVNPPAKTPPYPSLPEKIRLTKPAWETWVDKYVQHSSHWAPRAAKQYHAAVGWWVLSTIAARRIVCRMGKRDVYPTMFIALIGRSGWWTKTEAASIGVDIIRRAGCGHLLAPDRTTPQYLLRAMSGIIPQNYGSREEEEQTRLRNGLAFAAQKGWFYEEWGQMLQQMRQTESPQAELNKLLMVLEGGAETFETGTIARGLERVVKPYLALLGCATPRDLGPFMREGDSWWHTGFWPRFTFAIPQEDEAPSQTPRPREAYRIPGELLTPLMQWHHHLGIPDVTMIETKEATSRTDAEWDARVEDLPCREMHLTPETYDMYEAYNAALQHMILAGDISEDLTSWYLRAHEKALRLAMCVASHRGSTMITLDDWAEGQWQVEQWRQNMHHIKGVVGEEEETTRVTRLEHRIIRLIAERGYLTARELQRMAWGMTSEEANRILASMVTMERLAIGKQGKKTVYTLFPEDEGETMQEETE